MRELVNYRHPGPGARDLRAEIASLDQFGFSMTRMNIVFGGQLFDEFYSTLATFARKMDPRMELGLPRRVKTIRVSRLFEILNLNIIYNNDDLILAVCSTFVFLTNSFFRISIRLRLLKL